MDIDEIELRFIVRREKLVKLWPAAVVSMLSMFIILLIWLFRRSPLLVNPFLVFAQLEAGSIDTATLSLMAAMLPVMVLVCLLLVLVMVVYGMAIVRQEKKYLDIIRRNLATFPGTDDTGQEPRGTDSR